MAALDLPCTVSVAATATPVQIAGHWTRLCALNLGTAVVYARADGATAVVAANRNLALLPTPAEDTDILCAPSGGKLAEDGGSPVTNLSMISTTGTTLIHLYADSD